jgi:hypothetical protein
MLLEISSTYSKQWECDYSLTENDKKNLHGLIDEADYWLRKGMDQS